MLVKYFNSNRLSVFYVIPLLMALCWLPYFIVSGYGTVEVFDHSGILGQYIIKFNQEFPVLAALTAMVIIITNGFLIIQLNTIHLFIPHRTQIPALFYMLVCSAFPMLHGLTPALFASLIILILLLRILGTYKRDSLSYNFLDAGILISFASFFYPPVLLFYPVLLIIMSIIKPYIWREWVFTIIGLILPYLFLVAIYYLSGADFSVFKRGIRDAFLEEQTVSLGPGSRAFIAYIVFLLFVGSLYMVRVMGNIKIQSRKFFMAFLWIFIIAAMIYLIVPAAGFEMLYFISVPLAYLTGFYFAQCRNNWVNNLLLFLFLTGIVAVQVFR